MFTPEIQPNRYYPTHAAIDEYRHFDEDIALFAEMGFKVFRLSINWARLFPNGDDEKPNPEGVEYYRHVFTKLKEAGIEPLVTISHYEMPIELARKNGGWKNRSLIDFYLNLCQILFTEYKDLVHYWLTFNEINVLANGYGDIMTAGILPQEETMLFKPSATMHERFQALHNQFVASAKAVKLAHEINPENKVGCMIAATVCYPRTCHPQDILGAREKMNFANFYCGDVQVRGAYSNAALRFQKENEIELDFTEEDRQVLKEGTVDFYSFSYYMSSCYSHDPNQLKSEGNMSNGTSNPYLETSDWGWQIDPDGLRYYLTKSITAMAFRLWLLKTDLAHSTNWKTEPFTTATVSITSNPTFGQWNRQSRMVWN